MVIEEIKKEGHGTVYHVEDNGCIQEFLTLKGAVDFVKYVQGKLEYQASIHKMMELRVL